MQGAKKRIVNDKRSVLKYNPVRREYYLIQVPIKRQYWGNALGYAKRASEIMGEESILRQFRSHRKILNKTVEKYFPS